MNEFYKIGNSFIPKKIVDKDKNPIKNLIGWFNNQPIYRTQRFNS